MLYFKTETSVLYFLSPTEVIRITTASQETCKAVLGDLRISQDPVTVENLIN